MHSQPVVADGNGRWPAVFVSFQTSYDYKITTSSGTQLVYFTEVPNVDPTDVAAGTVTPESLIATGHVHWEPIQGTKVGFVRLNGRTIGNGSSGASERANADTQNLFVYLWNSLIDGVAPVSTGRGASAEADFIAAKTITLLDGRSGVLRGLDAMGATNASRLGSAPVVTGAVNAPGSALGENTHVLLTAELASHDHDAFIGDDGHTHTVNKNTAGTAGAGGNPVGQSPTADNTGSNTTGVKVRSTAGNAATADNKTATKGSDTAHNVVDYGLLGTFFQSL